MNLDVDSLTRFEQNLINWKEDHLAQLENTRKQEEDRYQRSINSLILKEKEINNYKFIPCNEGESYTKYNN